MKLKLYTLLLTVAISTTAVLAQPVIGLQKTIGGSGDDYFTCMSLTKDSGLVIGGYSNSNKSGNKLEDSKGSYDYWILLLNSKGGIRGQKTIGGRDDDRLKAVEQTLDGGYILGGSSRSDYWIVKLDSTGNTQWDKTIGGSYVDELFTLIQTSDGGYIAGGSSQSEISGDKTEDTRGGYDYWVVKLDANGNIQWDKTIGGKYNDYLRGIIQTNDHGYLVGGYSESGISGEKTDSNRGGNDYWIVKLDNAGNVQWDKTFGGIGYDVLSAVVNSRDGGYLLGGTSSSDISGEKMQSSRGHEDYWIVKTNNLGQIEWSNTYGGRLIDELSSLEPTADGGYILGGYSTSNISGEKTENRRGGQSGYDYWIIKLNDKGAIQWDKTIGGMENDNDPKIKEIVKNRYIIAGPSQSGIGGDKIEGSKGVLPTNDYWLVEVRYSKPDSALAVATAKNDMQVGINKTGESFRVYPNPATNILHINTIGKASFNLSNQKGKTILTKTITNNGDIDVSKLPPGVYFLTNKFNGATRQVIIGK